MTGPSPLKVVLTPGRYAICACGRTENAPFCDGSHAGTEFSPEIVDLEEEHKFAWCRCRESGAMPRCDGTHTRRGPARE